MDYHSGGQAGDEVKIDVMIHSMIRPTMEHLQYFIVLPTCYIALCKHASTLRGLWKPFTIRLIV